MSDRCSLRVRTLRVHAPLFEKIGLLVEDEHEPNEVVMVDEQANYGLTSQLDELAKRGVVFLADASAGEQYGPALTVSDGSGEAIAVEADFNSNIVLRCDDDGEPMADELALVQRYVAAVKRAEAIIEGRVPHPRSCKTFGGTGDLGLTADRMYGTRTCGMCARSGIAIEGKEVVMMADWLTDVASVLDRLEEMLSSSGDGRLLFYARDLTRLVAWLRTQPRSRVLVLGALGAGVLVGAIALSTRKEPDAPE